MGINAEPAIDDPMTGERDSRRKQQSTRHLEHAVVLADVKAKPVVAAQGAASLDIVCARRPRRSVVGAEESLRRGRTKEMGKKKEASRLTGPLLI
jgi:hypothetical protein